MSSETITRKTHRLPDFGPLLFSLPAELRLEIYARALSLPRPLLHLVDDCRSLQWLAISPKIFLEAAPLIYTDSKRICLDLSLSHLAETESVSECLRSHADKTYLHDSRWAYPLMCDMIDNIDISVFAEGPNGDCRDPDGPRWCRQRKYMQPSNPARPLTGPRSLITGDFPVLTAAKSVTICVAYSWRIRVRDSLKDAIKEVWHGKFNPDVRARALENAPMLQSVVESVLEVNAGLRGKMPAAENITWRLDGSSASQKPERLVEELILEAGCWRQGS